MLKVIAVVPTYNGGKSLIKLISQLAAQDFYKIYILDDASKVVQPIRSNNPKVHLVSGEKNLGPVGNRNRILNLDMSDIILFCDDDMSLITPNIPKLLSDLFGKNINLGVLGAQIMDKNSKPITFNYDQESNPLFRWVEIMTGRLSLLPDPKLFDKCYIEVLWVLEGLFAIRSTLFQELNGFDVGFKRFAEGPDLCRRVRDHGYKIYLTNRLQARHMRPLSMFDNRRSIVLPYLRSSIRWYGKYNPIRDRLNNSVH
jgi:GT2 family glycosyltransferase